MNWKTTLLVFALHLTATVLPAQTRDAGISLTYGLPELRWPSHTPFVRGEFSFKSFISYGAEYNWTSSRGWGGGIGIITTNVRGGSDSVDVQRLFKYYYSEMDIVYSVIYIPLKFFYRIPVKKWQFQVSAALMPGFLYKGTVAEKQIPTSPLYTRQSFYMNYANFELGIMGEARVAYEIIPKLHLGATARYLVSDMDMKGHASGYSSSSIGQSAAILFFGLSANWRLSP